jgi:hypothetical protein
MRNDTWENAFRKTYTSLMQIFGCYLGDSNRIKASTSKIYQLFSGGRYRQDLPFEDPINQADIKDIERGSFSF